MRKLKILNQIFISLLVIMSLILICLLTIYENSQKEYVYLKNVYDVYGNYDTELNGKQIYTTNSRGKRLISILFYGQAEKEEVCAMYKDLYGVEEQNDRESADYSRRYDMAEILVYDYRMDKFLEEFNCYEGDVIFKGRVYSISEIIMYATNEEMEAYKAHKYASKVFIYGENEPGLRNH